ncbi:MAG: DUF932 domain-containing protein [Xanthobacteraceae bacterium]
MPHNLFQDTMAYVGELPWHGLGKRVPASVSAEEMIDAANLDWEVRKVRASGARVVGDNPLTYDRYMIVREPVGEETEDVVLAIVRKYELLQNREAFSFFDPFIENKWAEFHTAGALGRGERIWVLTRFIGDMVIAGDDRIERYLLLSNSHDGSAAVSIRFTPVRVVCQNTLNLALESRSGALSVKHTENMPERLARAQAEQMKRVIDKVFADAETLFGRMALYRIRANDTERFLELLFPRTELQKKERVEPQRWKRITTILEDPTITPSKTKDTLWALYNAIVRDEDYRQSGAEASDSRLNRIWFGSGNNLKLKTLRAAQQWMGIAA